FSRDWSSDVCSSDLALPRRPTWRLSASAPVPVRSGARALHSPVCETHPPAHAAVLQSTNLPPLPCLARATHLCTATLMRILIWRSEERRVGKEGRSR